MVDIRFAMLSREVRCSSVFIKDAHGHCLCSNTGSCFWCLLPERFVSFGTSGGRGNSLGEGKMFFLHPFLPGLCFLCSHISFTVYKT